MQHERDGDTNCNCYARYSYQSDSIGAGRLENKRTRGDHPNYSFIKIGQNTEKGPVVLKRLAVTETRMRNHQLKLVWKTLKRIRIIIIKPLKLIKTIRMKALKSIVRILRRVLYCYKINHMSLVEDKQWYAKLNINYTKNEYIINYSIYVKRNIGGARRMKTECIYIYIYIYI